MAKDKSDPVVTELQMIRKLLILALLQGGLTQGQLGGVLGLSQQDVSKMFPSGSLAALKRKLKKTAAEATTDGEPTNG